MRAFGVRPYYYIYHDKPYFESQLYTKEGFSEDPAYFIAIIIIILMLIYTYGNL